MALIVYGTNITRVSYGGSFIRTVVQNGTTLFNLSDWTYIGTSGSNSFSTSYNYGCCYFNAGSVPTGQLSWLVNNNFPNIAQYGANTVALVQVFAVNPDFGTFFVRNEFYRINQTA
jgi:hypothetical protein